MTADSASVVGRSAFDFVDLLGRRSADPLAAVDSQSSVRYVVLHHDPTRTAHRHPYSEEVMQVIAGQGHVWVEGSRLPVKKGDVVRIPLGAAHATVPDPGSTVELICFFPHPNLAENIVETDIAVNRPEGTP